MDLTIAHMVLVHERPSLCLDVLVAAHILIMVIVSHIGVVFLLEGLTPALSPDSWMVHVFPVVVHIPLVQRVRCKRLLRPPQVSWLSAEFLRFISLTPALSYRPFLILCRWWTEAWRTRGSWILVAHDTWLETRNDSLASLPCHTRSMWLLGMTRKVKCLVLTLSR
jgi:uncharacterized protein YjeT (DUF2065 family)